MGPRGGLNKWWRLHVSLFEKLWLKCLFQQLLFAWKNKLAKEWQGNTKSLLASYLCKESFSAWDLQANTFFIDPIYNKNSRSYHLVYEHGVSSTTPSGLPAGRGWLLMIAASLLPALLLGNRDRTCLITSPPLNHFMDIFPSLDIPAHWGTIRLREFEITPSWEKGERCLPLIIACLRWQDFLTTISSGPQWGENISNYGRAPPGFSGWGARCQISFQSRTDLDNEEWSHTNRLWSPITNFWGCDMPNLTELVGRCLGKNPDPLSPTGRSISDSTFSIFTTRGHEEIT